jgi:hypothetical protein
MGSLPSIDWGSLNWDVLDRLRRQFLSPTPGLGAYWTTVDDLANYDFTFGQRIRWKWAAVLSELRARGWTPPPGALLDWGCGSGVAGRSVIEFFAPDPLPTLRVFDHSPLATAFAAAAARRDFPAVTAEVLTSLEPGLPVTVGTLILSHVLNELDEPAGQRLRRVIDRADAVLWIEPGTFAESRALVAIREALREQFHVIAPCTHLAMCGLLGPGNERHWCHHFAPPPPGIMADSNWVQFAQRAGLDLRSLPYSFLVLERRGLRDPIPGLLPSGGSRLLGRARVYKGFAKLLSCQAEGVQDLELQKRVDPGLFKALKNETASSLWHWTLEGQRIVGAQATLASRANPPLPADRRRKRNAEN